MAICCSTYATIEKIQTAMLERGVVGIRRIGNSPEEAKKLAYKAWGSTEEEPRHLLHYWLVLNNKILWKVFPDEPR